MDRTGISKMVSSTANIVHQIMALEISFNEVMTADLHKLKSKLKGKKRSCNIYTVVSQAHNQHLLNHKQWNHLIQFAAQVKAREA